MPETLTIWSKFDTLPTDKDILSYPGATMAFERLTEADVSGAELLNRIRAIVLLTRLPVLKKDDWAKGSGKTKRTIRQFPDRIRRFADEIEAVNAHSLLFPGLSGDESHRRLYSSLPDIMRAYSDRLTGQVSVIAKLNARLSRERSLPQKLLLHLASWIHGATGKYFDEDISLLVSVAYAVDGSEKDVSTEALKVLHSPDRSTITLPRIVQIDLDDSAKIIQVTLEV